MGGTGVAWVGIEFDIESAVDGIGWDYDTFFSWNVVVCGVGIGGSNFTNARDGWCGCRDCYCGVGGVY